MYARLILNSGCTLQQLRDDLVGLLTGTISAASGLSACNTSTSEVVKTVNPEWTFVQHLADTSTRCHFVLSGVDDGGIQKTLGVLLTNTSGTLAWAFWMCGPWNSTTKKPAAIDVTGWTLTSSMTSGQFAEGGSRNLVNFANAGTASFSAPTANTGVFNTGTLQLQLSSVQGATAIVGHWGANHTVLLDCYDIPRWTGGSFTSAADWPYVLTMFRSPLYAAAEGATPPGPYLVSNQPSAAVNGMAMGGSASVTMAAPLSTELGGMTAYTYGGAGPAGGGGAQYILHRVAAATSPTSGWADKKNGSRVTLFQRLLASSPANATIASFAIPHRVSSVLFNPGTTTIVTTSYGDELVDGSDVYVSNGCTVGGGLAAAYKKA